MHTLFLIIALVIGVIGGVALLMWCLGGIGLGPEDREARDFMRFERDRDLR